VPLVRKFPPKKLREQMILNKTKRVNIILDSDAYRDALKNYERLRKDVPGLEIGVLKMVDKDPSVVGFDQTHKMIRTITPLEEDELFAYKVENNL
jgi:hypothetical protein